MQVTAKISKEGKWWVALCKIEDGYEYGTQAKKLSELDDMILDAAKTVGYNPTELEVVKNSEFNTELAQYSAAATQAKEAKARLGAVARKTAATLRAQDLTVRDIAQLMGITPARVSQLLAS